VFVLVDLQLDVGTTTRYEQDDCSKKHKRMMRTMVVIVMVFAAQVSQKMGDTSLTTD
jgi:hypothetical protein